MSECECECECECGMGEHEKKAQRIPQLIYSFPFPFPISLSPIPPRAARDMDMLSDRMAEMNSKNAKFVAPKWTAGLMVIPDKAHATSVGKFVGGTAFGCVMMPKMASTFLMMGWAASVGLLYSRGQPELVKDDMGNPGEVRPTSATAVLLTLALVTGFGAVFAVMGSLIGTIGGRLLPPGLAVQLVCHVGFFVAAAFFKTYQGDGSTGGKKKWGKNKGK